MCLDAVHADVREMAELIARAFKLDTIGIDLTRDERRPRVRGAMAAVRCARLTRAPDFRLISRSALTALKMLGALLQRDFPAGHTGRVPVVAIAESTRGPAVARMVAHILEVCGKTTALAYTGGVAIGGCVMRSEDSAGGEYARAVMFDPRVEAAVFALSSAGLIARGMPLDACDVSAVLDVESDAAQNAPAPGTVESLVAQTATRYAVLNADDARCVEIASRVGHVPICWVSAECRQSGAPVAPRCWRHDGDARERGDRDRKRRAMRAYRGQSGSAAAARRACLQPQSRARWLFR